jgi:hypothetical protein
MHYGGITAIILKGSKTLRLLSGENFNERGAPMLTETENATLIGRGTRDSKPKTSVFLESFGRLKKT